MALPRRRLLSLAAAATVGTAGCVEEPFEDDSDATPTPNWNSNSTLGCPPYEDAERVVCSADPPDDSLVFAPEPERADLPRAEIACRLRNDREESFATNFFGYSLHRRLDGEWFHLGPYAVPQPLHALPAGETHVRRLVVDNTDLGRVRPPEPDESDDAYGYVTARHGLGPGAYALAIDSSSEGPETTYAAAFELRGDPVPLVAPETVVGTERDGDRRIVEVEPTDSDADLDRLDLTIRRRSDPPRKPKRFVDEQLYHVWNYGLRAALANFDADVAAVEVRGDDSQFTRNATHGHVSDFLEYDGDTYEVEVDPHDG